MSNYSYQRIIRPDRSQMIQRCSEADLQNLTEWKVLGTAAGSPLGPKINSPPNTPSRCPNDRKTNAQSKSIRMGSSTTKSLRFLTFFQVLSFTYAYYATLVALLFQPINILCRLTRTPVFSLAFFKARWSLEHVSPPPVAHGQPSSTFRISLSQSLRVPLTARGL